VLYTVSAGAQVPLEEPKMVVGGRVVALVLTDAGEVVMGDAG